MNSIELHADFEKYLVKLGLRQTKQRRIILDAVLQLGSHVDAETIASEARKIDSSIGLATVYRTLQLMTNAGVLVERQFGKARSKFEVADSGDKHHDHLICNDCGAILEFFDEEVEKLQDAIGKKLGFSLVAHRMELFGKCLNFDTCEQRKLQTK